MLLVRLLVVLFNGVTCIGYHYCFSLCFQTHCVVHGVSPSFVVWDSPLLLMCRLLVVAMHCGAIALCSINNL
jgi:hypothetical protein